MMTSLRRAAPLPAVILLVVVGAGLVLRVCQLPHESAWLDEVFSLQCIDAPSLSAFLRLERATDSPLMMPVYFVSSTAGPG